MACIFSNYAGNLRQSSILTHKDRSESVEGHHPVSLTAQLHHQPVVCEVGDVVARLPDGHLKPGLDGAVLLKPPEEVKIVSAFIVIVHCTTYKCVLCLCSRGFVSAYIVDKF